MTGIIHRMENFPQTRFQGSKYRLISWIDSNINKLDYLTALDLFSGSASMSYYFKTQDKSVTSNDLMKWCYVTAKALVVNHDVRVSDDMIHSVLNLPKYTDHDHVIEENYDQVYFTKDENIWLDAVIHNINLIEDDFEKSIVQWALFQSCIIKRPYNLFHRKNLYMRTSEVKRSFGNHTTWNTPFNELLPKFIHQANSAVFHSDKENIALNLDAKDVSGQYDLVYLDPPYMKSNGTTSNYQDYYHFLNGILAYDEWERQINFERKHKPLRYKRSSWLESNKVIKEFELLINKFQSSHIVISYNTEGKPTPQELQEIIGSYKSNVRIYYRNINYALKNKGATELLVVASD